MKVLRISWRQMLWLTLLLNSTMGCRPLSYLGLAMPPVTAIQTLSQQSQGSDIYLRGKVINQAPFIDSGAYQIQDETGTIWVLSDRPYPNWRRSADQSPNAVPSDRYWHSAVRELYAIEIEQLDGVASNASQPQPLPSPATASQPIPPQPLPSPATASQPIPPQVIPSPATASQPIPPQVIPSQPSQPLIPDEQFLPHKRQAK